jgi:CubicO group peptidase (beta-lactamase class C family)
MSALIGVMTKQGLLSPSTPAPIPEWHSSADLRREIKIEHLLRMTTGLALDEARLGFDQTSQMYLHNDMARFAASAALIAPPGTRWHYSSGTTQQLLARIILPQRRQNWRQTDTARRLGGFFRQGYTKHQLRRWLLDKSWWARRDSARRNFCDGRA